MSDTNESDAALNPCPFCGCGDAQRVCDTGLFWVSCDACGTEGPLADLADDAVRKWNGARRAAPVAASDAVERVRIALQSHNDTVQDGPMDEAWWRDVARVALAAAPRGDFAAGKPICQDCGCQHFDDNSCPSPETAMDRCRAVAAAERRGMMRAAKIAKGHVQTGLSLDVSPEQAKGYVSAASKISSTIRAEALRTAEPPAEGWQPILGLVELIEELCDAVDAEGADVGGSRGSLTILREIGPALVVAKKALPAPPSPGATR